MDYWEKFNARIRECLTALDDQITEFKKSGQVGVARELQKNNDEIRGRLNGRY
jgi:hypothetical protein